MVLITYRCIGQYGNDIWSYSFDESAEKFLEEVQQYDGEKYFIINVLPVSDEFYKNWDGKLNGM
jgi:hypothetical protein